MTQRQQHKPPAARRNARLLTVDGTTRTLTEWATITGLSKSTILKRLGLGWSDSTALRRPLVPMEDSVRYARIAHVAAAKRRKAARRRDLYVIPDRGIPAGRG